MKFKNAPDVRVGTMETPRSAFVTLRFGYSDPPGRVSVAEAHRLIRALWKAVEKCEDVVDARAGRRRDRL